MHDTPDSLDLGAWRRALLAELVRTGLPGGDRAIAIDPQDDAGLRNRIQARLGRMVSHPRAIHVSVEAGVVRLGGRVLAKERDGLLEQLQQMPGVQKVVSTMSAHDNPQEIALRPEPVSLAAATR